MSQVTKNVVANFIGSGWSALMSVVFIPVYIHFMGIEAFGIIGLSLTIYSILVILDMGVSATLNREMARLSAMHEKGQEMRNLVRTLEVLSWLIAVMIGTIVFLSAPVIAGHWLQSSHLSTEIIQGAIQLMGLTIPFQFLTGFYAEGLLGLQRQVLLNGINITFSTVRGVGAIAVLWLVSPTVLAFFIWQALVTLFQMLWIGRHLWGLLKEEDGQASFQYVMLKDLWRFALGMSGISVLAIILTQMDKIILSKLLPLETFSYFMLASMVAGMLSRIVGPIYTALYPRFSQLVAIGDQKGLINLYHKSSQLMSILIFPVAGMIALYSREILQIWTQNTAVAEQTHLILSLLVIGTSLNALMHLPYALQLAHGWTRLAFYSNVVAVILLTPLIYLMTKKYGAVGAATIWIALNSGYLLVTLQIMHHRLLPDEKWPWYWRDVGLPLFASLAVIFSGRPLIYDFPSPWSQTIVLLGIAMLALAASTIAAPHIRAQILNRIC